ncbi:MAG TPA: hypothetical protein VIV12_23535 [Streptosporangiaceae bacterium]
MTQHTCEQCEDFYARALQTNERGNNRSRAHNRPERHGWSFQRPGGPIPAPACSLDNTDHRGQIDLCVYRDGAGTKHYQWLCEGHRGQSWRALAPEERTAWMQRRRRRTSHEQPPVQPQTRKR